MNLTNTKRIRLFDASGKPISPTSVRTGDTVYVYPQGSDKLAERSLVSLNPITLRSPVLPASPFAAKATSKATS
jgi:hypothetical protein